MEDEMDARLQAVGQINEDGDLRLEGTEVVPCRRFILWRLTRLLEENERQDHTDAMMQKLRDSVQTPFFLRCAYKSLLRNRENGDEITMWENKGSPWFNRIKDARPWL